MTTSLSRRLGATAALALSGVGVAGAAVASSASAANLPLIVVHNSAHYSSMSSCNTNHNGALKTIRGVRGGASIGYSGVCHREKGYYTYNLISYVATHKAFSTDWSRINMIGGPWPIGGE